MVWRGQPVCHYLNIGWIYVYSESQTSEIFADLKSQDIKPTHPALPQPETPNRKPGALAFSIKGLVECQVGLRTSLCAFELNPMIT